MTTPTSSTTARLFCSKCGRTAVFYAPTLDPALPLVSCSRVDREGKDEGCGVQPGSADWSMIQAVVAERRRIKTTANHRWHVRKGQPNPYCDTCKVDPPDIPTEPHPFEQFGTKYRTASHLQQVHHDRAMVPRLPLRTAGEVESHHKRLHG